MWGVGKVKGEEKMVLTKNDLGPKWFGFKRINLRLGFFGGGAGGDYAKFYI